MVIPPSVNYLPTVPHLKILPPLYHSAMLRWSPVDHISQTHLLAGSHLTLPVRVTGMKLKGGSWEEKTTFLFSDSVSIFSTAHLRGVSRVLLLLYSLYQPSPFSSLSTNFMRVILLHL